MYYEYYGLKQPPFKITPDTSLFFPGGDRGAILDALIYAIVSGEGIVKLVGEVGSGKTTLCRMLEKELPDQVEIVYLANPSLSPDNILHAIAFELGLQVKSDASRLKVMNSLQNYLLERHAENRQVVVFIEEAQSMPIATLEEVRLLSNLETAHNKLLQIVIFGQPELDAMIARPEIRQLKERITYSFYLNPLKAEEIRDYINSRLRACGYRASELFNDKAIKAIARYSEGLLRRINILADKALLASYADNMNTVTAKHVQRAASETEFVSVQPEREFNWSLIFGSGLILIALVFAFPYVQQLWESRMKPAPAAVQRAADMQPAQVVDAGAAAATAETAAASGDDNEAVVEQTQEQVSESEAESSIDKQDTVAKLLPAADELDEADWQRLNQNVYVYTEQDQARNSNSVADTQPNGMEEMMGIEQIAGSVTGRTQEELMLLEQLANLPPEVVMNDETLATDTACKLCSTFIYRPLKEGSKL